MIREKIRDCGWNEFERMTRERIGSDFTWRVRLRDTPINRVCIMESVLTAMVENYGAFPAEGNRFIAPVR